MAHLEEVERLKTHLEDIKVATNKFSEDNFISHGGSGTVYGGQLGDHSSTTNMVKRLDKKICGEDRNESSTELGMLSRYRHDNIVPLVGFTDEELYEHEVHGSLDLHLADTNLTLEKRLRICLGAARGLEYLHSGVGKGHEVLHGDVKSSNIMLDVNWEAKISNIGWYKMGYTNQESPFLGTNDVGTYGYVDPQYLETGVLTKESDVYSFGVVLFEVLCGRLAVISEYNDVRRFLFRLVKLHYKEERLDEIIMTSLLVQMKPHTLQTFSKIAYQCLNDDRKQRPTMTSIVQELQSALEFQTGCLKATRIWGSSSSGSPWSLQLDNNRKLKRITIDHEDWIYSVRFTTQDSNGSLMSSQQHGGTGGSSGGRLSEINFDADEEITEILGTIGVTTGNYAGYTVISSLTFITNKKKVGPFGKEDETRFSLPINSGSFVGFYGRAGFYLDGMGFYIKVTI